MSKVKVFPRDIPVHATFVTQRNAPSDGFLLFWGPSNPDTFDWTRAFKKMGLPAIPESWLMPAQARLILPSQQKFTSPAQKKGNPQSKERKYRIETIVGRCMSMKDAILCLGSASFEQYAQRPKAKRICPSVIAWSYAAKFTLELISRQCFVPTIKTNKHELFAVWQATLENSLDIGRLRQLAGLMPQCAHALYSVPKNNRQDNGQKRGKFARAAMMWHPEALLRAFLDAGVDAFIRNVMSKPESRELVQSIRENLAQLEHPDDTMSLEDFLEAKWELSLDTLKSQANYLVELFISANTPSASCCQAETDSSDDESDEPGDDEETDEDEDSNEIDDDDDSDDDEDDDEETDEDETESDDDSIENQEIEETAETESAENQDQSNDIVTKAVMPEPQPKPVISEDKLRYRRYCELRRLLPMKEYVYPVPTELQYLPRWESRWFEALISDKTRSRIDYHLEDPNIVETFMEWVKPIHENTDLEEIDAKTGFWLEAPTAETENMWFLRYVLVAVEDPTLAIPANLVFSIGTERLRLDQHSFENPQEKLLTDLGQAAAYFDPIKKSLENAKPEGIFLDVKQAWTFISEVSPLLYSAGFDVRLPEQLTDQGARRLRARFKICDATPDDLAKSYFGLNDLACFQWEAALGDEVVSVEEFKAIVALKQPLIQWKGAWVLVDPVQLRDIEALICSNESRGTLTRFDAMNRALTGVADPGSPNSNIEVVVEGKIADVLTRLTQEDIADMTQKAPDTFVGTLRPYQERGAAWLSYQQRLGLGCCLADDMGLGKTIQLICHVLNQIKRNPTDKRGTLLICPMSVVGNWKREFARFAPSVNVVIHHGSDRAQSLKDLHEMLAIPGTVVITTYGLITRNSDFLFQHQWAMIVLDEAQAIKNASSKRSVLVRELSGEFKVALTGTPIENRLAELWSILDFLNPGLLGKNERFQKLYGIPIERYNDEAAMNRLRNLVSPFILRRVKTDPKIIQDLPEKMEHKLYCTLTREQATMYQALVDATMKKIESAVGIARHGHVLALLTHLKQIIDHPALYEKGTTLSPARSGKVQCLIEMLETILENGEKALIFTQFKEMGDVLVDILQSALELETVPFFHGGLTARQRDEIVADFQSEDGPPFLILSLKAGGTGLNLTAATHVFHFDRWWNPAVENQATDRAFRIGQDKNVQVHKFLTLGTLEEKIDTMLEEKKFLSDSIVDASGAWITQFDADGLRELFSLSSDAMIDETN